MENDNYGVTGLLDYVLRMKARFFYQRKEKELCSACLWKATEMMFANPLCKWSKKDYVRILKYHLLLDMVEEAERAKKYLESKGMIFTEYESQAMKPKSKKQPKPSQRKKGIPKEKIDWREKELITVQNITTDGMRRLNMVVILQIFPNERPVCCCIINHIHQIVPLSSLSLLSEVKFLFFLKSIFFTS